MTKTINFRQELNEMKKVIKNLNNEIRYLTASIEKIENSKAYILWYFLKKIKTKLNYLFSFKKNCLGILNFVKQKRQRLKERKYIQRISKPLLNRFYKVSIIIPTYQAESLLPTLLTAINAQKFLDNPEIIVIDSQSSDETKKIATGFGAKLLNIEKSKFTHGGTRNLAVKETTNDLILFTVQDALPATNTTYAEMLNLISSDEKIAAVSVKQQFSPDADLFARWQVENHNNLLDLNYDFISNVTNFNNFNKESFMLKRKTALLDDVGAVYRRDIFKTLGEFHNVGFGEDMYFAYEALKAGYKLGILCSNKIIHSHNRSSEFFLKRSFISSLADLKLFSNIDKEKKTNLGLTLKTALLLTEYLNSSVFVDEDFFAVSIRGFLYEHLYLNIDENPQSNLGQLFNQILSVVTVKQSQPNGEEIIHYYQALIHMAKSYFISIKGPGPSLIEKKEFLEKIIASDTGHKLALYCLGKQTASCVKNKQILIRLLTK